MSGGSGRECEYEGDDIIDRVRWWAFGLVIEADS